MLNKIKKIRRVFFNDVFHDFISKLTAMLIVVYVFLFGLEVILPGIIIEVFNINLLLFAILLNLSLILIIGKKLQKGVKSFLLSKWIAYGLLIFLIFVLIFSLSKRGAIESLVYTSFAVGIGTLIKKRLLKDLAID